MNIKRSGGSWEGRRRRNEAMAQVAANDRTDWRKQAELSIIRVANRMPDEFTGDDIWDDLAQRKVPEPHERRLMGPVITRMMKEGFIEKLGYIPSRRPERHCGPVAVYKRVAQ